MAVSIALEASQYAQCDETDSQVVFDAVLLGRNRGRTAKEELADWIDSPQSVQSMGGV
jgi:hypothetical protein